MQPSPSLYASYVLALHWTTLGIDHDHMQTKHTQGKIITKYLAYALKTCVLTHMKALHVV